MPRNRSEKGPFPHVPEKFLERLRLYAVWAHARSDVRKEREAYRDYENYRLAFTDEERSAYEPFMCTDDFLLIKSHWMRTANGGLPGDSTDAP